MQKIRCFDDVLEVVARITGMPKDRIYDDSLIPDHHWQKIKKEIKGIFKKIAPCLIEGKVTFGDIKRDINSSHFRN